MPFGKKRNENDIIFRGYKTLKLLVKELRKNETDIRSGGCNLKKKTTRVVSKNISLAHTNLFENG